MPSGFEWGNGGRCHQIEQHGHGLVYICNQAPIKAHGNNWEHIIYIYHVNHQASKKEVMAGINRSNNRRINQQRVVEQEHLTHIEHAGLARYTSVCDMTQYMCGVTLSYVTWIMHVYGKESLARRSCVTFHSTWLIRTCDRTHSYMWSRVTDPHPSRTHHVWLLIMWRSCVTICYPSRTHACSSKSTSCQRIT